MAISHQGSFNSTATGDFAAQLFCTYVNIQLLLTGRCPPPHSEESDGMPRHCYWESCCTALGMVTRDPTAYMYELVWALLDFKSCVAPGFPALSAAENTKASQAAQNTARSAEGLALCPLPCCCSLFDQVACQGTAIPVPKLRAHWVWYISMKSGALQFLLKGRVHLSPCTAASCKGAVCRLSVVCNSCFFLFCQQLRNC